MSYKTDQELFQAIQSGDEFAFQCLFSRHWEVLYKSIFKLLSDEDQTKDVVQNAFIEIWVKRETLVVGSSILPYLVSVAKNEVISLFRKKKICLAGEEILIGNLHKVTHPDEQIIARELQQKIDHELVNMPFNMRKCFVLSRYEDKSIRHIAHELTLSEQTVKNNISEALRRLRKRLETNSAAYPALLFALFINLTQR
ncbi:RNA polymerase sigma factor (sigma-70 family) [Pedobacter sp. UYP24]